MGKGRGSGVQMSAMPSHHLVFYREVYVCWHMQCIVYRSGWQRTCVSDLPCSFLRPGISGFAVPRLPVDGPCLTALSHGARQPTPHTGWAGNGVLPGQPSAAEATRASSSTSSGPLPRRLPAPVLWAPCHSAPQHLTSQERWRGPIQDFHDSSRGGRKGQLHSWKQAGLEEGPRL